MNKELKLVLCMILIQVSIWTGCGGNAVTSDESSDVGLLVQEAEKSDGNPLDYVNLGDYKAIEVNAEGYGVYVGEVYIDIAYRDEESMNERTLQYYYSKVSPEADKTSEEYPTDEEVAKLGLPEITSFYDLQEYVCKKVFENDDVVYFTNTGDALMEQVVANSTYEDIPEDVMTDCEAIYNDYLAEMTARYTEIDGDAFLPKNENGAYKVLAAMAIAKDAGIDKDGFDYEEVLKYLIEWYDLNITV